MHTEKAEIGSIISGLNNYEIKVMLLLGKKEISLHRNIRKETIKNELPNKYGKNVDKAIKSLLNKGLMYRYRNKNYGLTEIGILAAHKLVEDFRDARYNDLRILLII